MRHLDRVSVPLALLLATPAFAQEAPVEEPPAPDVPIDEAPAEASTGPAKVPS